MDNVIRINTIEDYTDFFGCPAARHPLMSLCRLSGVKDFVSPGCPVELNLYTIVVKDDNTCTDYLRTQTGQNTQQHIHAYLIDRAKHLLVTTDSPASEIAYRLGFEYPQHFARFFKQKTGLTPIEFRRAG